MPTRTIIILTILCGVLVGALQYSFRAPPEAVITVVGEDVAEFQNKRLALEDVADAVDAMFSGNDRVVVTIVADKSSPAASPLFLYEEIKRRGYNNVDIQSSLD